MNIERGLRGRIAELEEENRQLRELLSPPVQFRIEIGPIKMRMLGVLYARVDQWVRLNMLFAAGGWRDEGSENLVRQHIFQMRQKLHPLDIRIKSQMWYGYMLDAKNAEKLKALVI